MKVTKTGSGEKSVRGGAASFVVLAALVGTCGALGALGACGGQTASPGDAGGGGEGGAGNDAASGADGAGGGDAGAADATTCPPGTPAIPTKAVYGCDAAPPDSGGCRAAPSDPNGASDPNVYPLGCAVTLPTPAPFCGGNCCGPQVCNCQTAPVGSGAEFICPL